jgi:hypothetical protein
MASFINTKISFPCNDSKDYNSDFTSSFFKTLAEIINKHIIPTFGTNLKMSIELGFFCSDEYGCYKISFTQNENIVGYIIADYICGIWEVFKSK